MMAQIGQQEQLLSAGSYKVFYIYEIPIETHKNRVKIGDATLHTHKTIEELIEHAENKDGLYSSDEIKDAARARIDQQTKTADIPYNLLGAFLSVRKNAITGRWENFRDYAIHDVLNRNGYKKEFTRKDKKTGEWYTVDPHLVVAAAQAVVSGSSVISDDTVESAKITLREEQKVAVAKTKKVFKNGTYEDPKRFLWNAIMRFGKTVTAFQLIKELDPEVKKVLVITHRPVVAAGWADDFHLIFDKDSEWSFGSKRFGETWDQIKDKEKFIYFASVQDLRGSFIEDQEVESLELDSDSLEEDILSENDVEEIFTKNKELFETQFDLTVCDESHEGLKTDRADKMFESIQTKYRLDLSGTPFNLIDDYDADNIFNWSYIDEQMACEEWEEKHPNDSNPYGSLPKLEIRTIDISNVFKNFNQISPANTTFDFNKFFEVDRTVVHKDGEIYKDGYFKFKNESAVRRLLSLMTNTLDELDPETGEVTNLSPSTFPFVNDNSWIDFADTFWVLPTVEASMALHELLSVIPSFHGVKVVNATGNNDSGNPLQDVKDAILENNRTITLSVGKLTTGTTIPEWTAVFMLCNMKSPMSYMQTIFRSKSSGSLRDGRAKETAYVFDFAPDRALEMVVNSARKIAQSKIADENLKLKVIEEDDLEKATIDNFLKYLPIIAYDGVKFQQADSSFIMKALHRVFIAQNISQGFASLKMYNREALLHLDGEGLSIFDSASKIVGKSTSNNEEKKVDINQSALTENQSENLRKDPKFYDKDRAPFDRKDDLSEDDERELEQWEIDAKAANLQAENIRKMMITLRGVSVRLPLLILGAPTQYDSFGNPTKITVDNFADLVDDKSWAEFMPKGFKKYGANEVSWEYLHKFYDRDIFEGSVQGLQDKIRDIFRRSPLDRVLPLAHLFTSFRNPDRETILTPFSVVNLQYVNTLGGLSWMNQAGLARVRNINTDEISFIELDKLMDSTIYKAEPIWVEPQDSITSDNKTLDEEKLSNYKNQSSSDLKNFWNDEEVTILDINSKTALYPLFAAASRFYIEKEKSSKRDAYIGKRALIEDDEVTKIQIFKEDNELWKTIIESNIFVNCRVPYSATIAKRVLGGYDEEIQVNASVVDIIEVRKFLKDSKIQVEDVLKNGEVRVKERFLNDDEIAVFWRWIFNPESIRNEIKIDRILSTEERVNKIMSNTSSKDILDILEESAKIETKNFTSVVSNPPYQSDNNGQYTHIWHRFIEISNFIADNTSFIHPVGWIKGKLRMKETKDNWRKSKKLRVIIYNSDSVFHGVGLGSTSITFFTNKILVDSTKLIFSTNGVKSESIFDWDKDDFESNSLRDSLKLIAERIEPEDPSHSMYSVIKGKTHFAIEGGRIFKGRMDLVKKDSFEGSLSVLAEEKIGDFRKDIFYIDPNSEDWESIRNRKDFKSWKVAFPATGDQQWRRKKILEPNSAYTGKFVAVFFNDKQSAINMSNYLETDFYHSLIKSKMANHHAMRDVHRSVPLVNFSTGEMLDKPGVFLDFSKPETLDEQLAKIYKLSEEEQELMRKDLKPWKDKTSVTADM